MPPEFLVINTIHKKDTLLIPVQEEAALESGNGVSYRELLAGFQSETTESMKLMMKMGGGRNQHPFKTFNAAY